MLLQRGPYQLCISYSVNNGCEVYLLIIVPVINMDCVNQYLMVFPIHQIVGLEFMGKQRTESNPSNNLADAIINFWFIWVTCLLVACSHVG